MKKVLVMILCTFSIITTIEAQKSNPVGIIGSLDTIGINDTLVLTIDINEHDRKTVVVTGDSALKVYRDLDNVNFKFIEVTIFNDIVAKIERRPFRRGNKVFGHKIIYQANIPTNDF